MNFGPQAASNSTAILPTLRKFCILLYCHASHTEIRKQNSTKFCQTVDGKSRLRICRRTVGVVSQEKIRGQETFTFVRYFNDFDT